MTEPIATLLRTRAILDRYGLRPRKGFGQNFLVDPSVPRAIVADAGVGPEDAVLEIGPGIGSMTQFLAENAKTVVAVELDKGLLPVLADTLMEYRNVHVVQGDILKTDIGALSRAYNEGRPFRVVANLPYYITTPILMELLSSHAPVSSLTVMMQKEVAERLTAAPGTAAYGALTLAVAYRCSVAYCRTVPATCFFPRPQVDSAVVRLDVLPQPRVQVKNEDFLFRITRCAFGQRRKTLVNCLYNQAGLGLSKEELAGVLASLGLPETVRGEKLDLETFAALADILYREEK